MSALAAALAVAGSLFGLYRYVLFKSSAPAHNNPKVARRRLARMAQRPTVVACLGDSITHGRVSGDYVARVRDALGDGFFVVNGGVNSECSWNLRQRIDDALACDPDVVTIMIGTNDYKGIYDASWGAATVRSQRLPQALSPAFYRDNLRAVLASVTARRPGKPRKVALLELVPFGEQLEASCQATVARANAALAELGSEFGVAVLPVNARLRAFLSSAPAPATPCEPFETWVSSLYPDIVKHHVLGMVWDRVGAAHGFRVMSDGLHLNDVGAQIVADTVVEFIRSE